MCLKFAVVVGALFVGALAGRCSGQARSFTDRPVPGMRQMDRHNPFSPGYVDMTPGGFARRQAYALAYGFSGSQFHGAGSLIYGSGFFFDHRSFAPPPFFYAESFPPFPLAPLPEPVFGPAPWPNIPRLPEAQPAERAPVRPRTSGAEAVARAARYLTAGDEHFAAQRYRDANARYRSATEAAPDLVEAFFRQGQALLATGQFDLAGKAFQRGLRLGNKWPQAAFNLGELYGNNQVAKAAHMEAVAAAAEDAPQEGALWLLVALELHFDGQPERSLPFFRRAAELLPAGDLNLDAVLKGAT